MSHGEKKDLIDHKDNLDTKKRRENHENRKLELKQKAEDEKAKATAVAQINAEASKEAIEARQQFLPTELELQLKHYQGMTTTDLQAAMERSRIDIAYENRLAQIDTQKDYNVKANELEQWLMQELLQMMLDEQTAPQKSQAAEQELQRQMRFAEFMAELKSKYGDNAPSMTDMEKVFRELHEKEDKKSGSSPRDSFIDGVDD